MELFATDMQKLDFLLEADAYVSATCNVRSAQSEGEEPRTEHGELSTAGEERPRYVATYIGSKQKLIDWIWRSTPEGVKSVLDAFSGSAVVAYMYKTKGLRVVANDRLRYAYHTARAIIENRSVTLSDAEIEALVADNPKAGDFVQRTFKGIYFSPGIHKVIDTIRANIDALGGFKKDIALFALGKTCITGSFGHFSSTTEAAKRKYTPEEFKARFTETVRRINALVFDNGQRCEAMQKDILDALAEVKVDLAYFDPPYATHFSTTNYEKNYHFIEGLMTYWDGLEIETGNKIRNYRTDHQTVTKANAAEFFDGFFAKAHHIPHWIISYRDKAYPSEAEMKKLIAAHGRASRMRSKDHEYMITNVHGEASHAKEHLFICQRASAQCEVDSARLGAEGDDLFTSNVAPRTSNYSEAVWEETENEIRYRVRPPEHFRPDTFRRKKLKGVEGVSIVIAKLKPEHVAEGKDPDSMVVQAFRFARKTDENPDGWTMERAKKWIAEHEKGANAECGVRNAECGVGRGAVRGVECDVRGGGGMR